MPADYSWGEDSGPSGRLVGPDGRHGAPCAHDRWHPVSMRRPLLLVALALATALAVLPAMSVAQEDTPPLVTLEARGAPLVVGQDERIALFVTLARPAELRLYVEDFDGRLVRELFAGSRRAGEMRAGWHGRDPDGARVRSGPYRVVAKARAEGMTERAATWVTVAEQAVYPKAPGLITVAVDPGHGRDYDGAIAADGTREADLNLDIGRRLWRMLQGAGVEVAITRRSDANANEPPRDRTGDGELDNDDDLAARTDLANEARADLFVSIHNNWAVNPAVGGPSTHYFAERPFGTRSARLARLVQEEMVAALDGATDGEWEPHDHGALTYPYYVLRGYDPPRLKRPTQMPGVLSEGLFLSNARELALLKRRHVRAHMAVAYYDAIARYLAGRGAHVGYELVRGPAEPVAPGEATTFTVEVRNQGTQTLVGWRLGADAIGAPARYVGRTGRGREAGVARIPRLAPGETAVVRIEVTPPADAREWMLLFDARDRDGVRASALGSPALQVRLPVLELPRLPRLPHLQTKAFPRPHQPRRSKVSLSLSKGSPDVRRAPLGPSFRSDATTPGREAADRTDR